MYGRTVASTSAPQGLVKRLGGAALTLLALLAGTPPAAAEHAGDGRIHLQIVGGLAGVTQYTKLEQPFWQNEIAERSNGRITASIRPFDGGGLRGQEMLQLMRLGVVPFGTALLSLVSGDDPELNAVDLPVLNPDMATLRRSIAGFREHLAEVLRVRYDIQLLAVYAYPAQVLFCTRPFSGLTDLAGRKIRTSSVGQSELMSALGAVPVLLPFKEIVSALKSGVVDCAVTGTLSGYEIGLQGITDYVHSMAITWGLSFFGANMVAWNALSPEDQKIISTGIADLERRIMDQAEADTARGLACNTGAIACGASGGPPMKLVPASAADEARRQELLSKISLPRWIERCGAPCAEAWNLHLAPTHTFTVKAE
ncbi:TRAP transporter substrate-binding protein [Xanthobacter sp. KR7-65]|uniref:TRAP transporter substrate-binding protein n=1 Tax=Xanthobacter sp. KR7-65 TaxID=3156612 RepID=UPI0032B48925